MNQSRKGEVTIAIVVLIVLVALSTIQFANDLSKEDNNASKSYDKQP